MIGMCECCHTEEIEVTDYPARIASAEARLCEVCAHSMLGHSVEYPRQWPPGLPYVATALGWIANRLLNEIAELRAEVRELKDRS